MPKLYGEMVTNNKMKVELISYSGNKDGGVEVEEVLEGEGTHYVDPSTGEQWFELPAEEKANAGLSLEQKIDKLLSLLEGGGEDGLGT